MKVYDHFKDTHSDDIDQCVAKITDVAESVNDFCENRVDNYELSDVCALYFLIKTHYEAIDRAKKEWSKLKTFMERAIIPEKMEKADVDMVRLPDLARSFSLQKRYSASIVDKEAAFKWLRESGNEDIIQETVNAGTLSSFCRSLMLDEGIEPPEDAVKVSSYNAIGVNKYTPK